MHILLKRVIGLWPKGASNGPVFRVFWLHILSCFFIEFIEFFKLYCDLAASSIHRNLRLFLWIMRSTEPIALVVNWRLDYFNIVLLAKVNNLTSDLVSQLIKANAPRNAVYKDVIFFRTFWISLALAWS